MSGPTREQRARWGSIGGLTVRARHTPGGADGYTSKARETFLKGFEAIVDPDGTMDPVERAARAEAAKRAHMRKLAEASAKARAERARGPMRSRQTLPEALAAALPVRDGSATGGFRAPEQTLYTKRSRQVENPDDADPSPPNPGGRS